MHIYAAHQVTKKEILLINDLFPEHIEKIARWENFIKDIGPSKIINIGSNPQKHIIIKYNESNKTYNIQ